ncbi:MAG: hypothetical protein QOI38_2354 [Sphingomonadales bacterium]|nr:hypothetical protein [Sphingomonadales bacterium]
MRAASGILFARLRARRAGAADSPAPLHYGRVMVPAVSVILPVYNRPAYLRAAIDSVRRQSFTAWELLIVDDGSDDAATLAILSEQTDERIRVLRLAHVGLPAVVRNAGLSEARAEYVAFLDSDDRWLGDKLARQVDAMRARPECGWSYGPIRRVDEDGSLLGDDGIQKYVPHDREMVHRLLRIDALVAMPSVMMRRELAELLGGFDATLRYCEDYDLWIRAAMRSDVVVLESALAEVRVHRDNYSSDRLGVHRSWVELFDKYSRHAPSAATRRIARRRKAVSALAVATLLSQTAGGRGEALQILRRHGPRLLLDPSKWSAVIGLLARLLPRNPFRSRRRW